LAEAKIRVAPISGATGADEEFFVPLQSNEQQISLSRDRRLLQR
jgi:hypothetical protein